MLGLAVKPCGVAALARVCRLVDDFLGLQPCLEEVWRDVKEDALSKLFDRRPDAIGC
jgi:hypothetical protein